MNTARNIYICIYINFWCFNTVPNNAFSFLKYYVKFNALFLTIQKRFIQRQDLLLSFLFCKKKINKGTLTKAQIWVKVVLYPWKSKIQRNRRNFQKLKKPSLIMSVDYYCWNCSKRLFFSRDFRRAFLDRVGTLLGTSLIFRHTTAGIFVITRGVLWTLLWFRSLKRT